MDDIYRSRKFNPEYIYGMKPLNDGEHYCMMQEDSLNVYSYKTGDRTETLVTANQLIPESDAVPISMRRYRFSKSEKQILFVTETESIYRHSSKSTFYVYDIESEKLTMLSDEGKQRLATFSPDGSKVAFVRKNNFFIKDLEKNIEFQITSNGLYNNIIYGTTDWVCEEEFGFTKTFFW